MKIKFIQLSFLLAIFSITVLLAGCDSRSINPMEESSGAFSVYGALSLNETPNYIRVKDLTIPFLSDSASRLDAKVTFEDMEEGTSTVLEDTVVNFSGHYTHNFILNQELEPDRAYRLTVERSNGTSVMSMATTPAITEVIIFGADPGDIDCLNEFTTRFENVKFPENIRMEVGFTYNGSVHWAQVGKVDEPRHRENADHMFITMSPRHYLIEVFPPPGIDNPAIDPRRLSPTVDCHELDSNVVMVRYIHFGPEWNSLSGEMGPVDPLESSDVEGGLGFLGAYREGSFTFRISNEDE